MYRIKEMETAKKGRNFDTALICKLNKEEIGLIDNRLAKIVYSLEATSCKWSFLTNYGKIVQTYA